MTGFALGAFGLVLLAAWMLRPAWRPSLAPAGTRPAHLGVLGEQLAALDRELDAGQLDARQHARARTELQRRVLDEAATDDPAIDSKTGVAQSPKTLLFIALAVPLFAVSLYALIGNPAALDASPSWTAAQAAAEPEVSAEAVQAMLASLAQRLEKPSANPAIDVQGWTMLARSYAALQRFADADRALARAIALAPDDAQLLADRADVLALLQDSHTAGESERLIAQALRIDPKNLKALALAGSAAFERQDFAEARAQWQRARELAPPGSEFAAGLDRSLDAVRDVGGDTSTSTSTSTSTPAPAATSTPTPPSTSLARITGRVSLSPALAANALPTDTVFVFARSAEGPRMPLAIIRRTVADLPFTFTLDDSLAMSPQTRLSGAERVVVGARVSRSGNAMPQAGDLRGESATIGTRSDGLQLSIDSVQR